VAFFYPTLHLFFKKKKTPPPGAGGRAPELEHGPLVEFSGEHGVEHAPLEIEGDAKEIFTPVAGDAVVGVEVMGHVLIDVFHGQGDPHLRGQALAFGLLPALGVELCPLDGEVGRTGLVTPTQAVKTPATIARVWRRLRHDSSFFLQVFSRGPQSGPGDDDPAFPGHKY
jgi:hypothetical protein